MTISMKVSKALSLEEIRALMAASESLGFEGTKREEVYEWVRQTLVMQEYHKARRSERGQLREYIGKMTGLSRAQVTRLIKQYLETGEVKARAGKRRRFARQYTREDIELLAEVDELHETMSGPATVKIMYRQLYEYGKREYERLAGISVAHLYNLRKSAGYRKRRIYYEKTKPTKVGIGERRKPEPEGRPGYLRVDTVHQGDLDGVKGLYHVTVVDEMTQWQVMGGTWLAGSAVRRALLARALCLGKSARKPRFQAFPNVRVIFHPCRMPESG